MILLYVFDTNSIRSCRAYYPGSFPTLWEGLDKCVLNEELISVREVRKELNVQDVAPHVMAWVENHKHIFVTPTTEELAFVTRVFEVPHFQQLVGRQQQLNGSPVADPFVIAAAACRDGCVVTEEVKKTNAAKIPNVCDHFDVGWVNFEEFLNHQGWTF